jgi:hypothetical protein
MNFKGLNDNRITVEAGISNGLIGKARKRGSLSQENISKILHKYNDLDANWLFTGNGSMLKSVTVEKQLNDIDFIQLKKEIAQLKEINDLLRFKIATQEKEISELKCTQNNPILYRTVAEPAPELTSKKHK